MNDFFNTLGIEATKEEKKIKKAYRARLHAVNPEDDPDGFKRLREAYEEALKYARQKEEEPENLSPAEEFISRCEQLYKDFYRRIDEQEGKAFFRRYLYQLRKRRGSTPEISCIFNGEFPSAITSMEKD